MKRFSFALATFSVAAFTGCVVENEAAPPPGTHPEERLLLAN